MNKVKSLLIILVMLSLALAGYMRYNHYNFNDIGLKALTLIKSIKGEAVDITQISQENTMTIDHSVWTELLKLYVADNGDVNYKGFISDQKKLNAYLNSLSSNPPDDNWSRSEKLAYWVNAYNAFTIKLILDHYPLKSIKDIADGLPMIDSPWDIKFFEIGGVPFDLNTIEHSILREEFDEPRIHFAINCASVSCPLLRNEAFTAEQLENQLEDQAYGFINNPKKNIINNKATQISPIFDWFGSDFKKHETIKLYVKRYNSVLNENIKVSYTLYDWNLNEQ